MVKSFAAVLPAVVAAKEEHWAVIAAGSNGWVNYRHHADACHAYQVAKAKGIKEDHIIMLAYDDIANDFHNPFPGQLFNKPAAGPGVDVYGGCNIDYKGADVTPQNFMDVLTGSASGRKLESTSEDNVFVYFTDHGGPGIIGFPNSDVLHKEDLQKTLQTMSDKKMFNKLTFYLEACESGSMFEDMSIPGVYAVSAAGTDEDSWGAYCNDGWSTQCDEDNHSCVNGKNIDSCLGDLFSVNWMEEADASDMTKESLQDNFGIVKTKTDKSQVTQWSDTSFTDAKMSEFIGNLNVLGASASASAEPSKSAISARKVDLERLYRKYVGATTSADRLRIGQELQQELDSQLAVDIIHTKFLSLVYPGNDAKQEAMRTDKVKPSLRDCEVRVHKAFMKYGAQHFEANSGFALQFHQIVVNVCADQAKSNGPISKLEGAVKDACAEGIVV